MKQKMPYIWSLLMTAGIGILLLVPFSEPTSMPHIAHADKAVHCGLFFCLTAIILWESAHQYRTLIAFIWSIGWGGAMEICQSALNLYTGREGSWWDWAADIAGTVVAVLLLTILKKHNILCKRNN